MHVIEFCQFIDERSKFSSSFSKTDLVQIRVLRGPNLTNYTLVIKLKSPQATTIFYSEFQSRKFNQIEPEKCEVYLVKENIELLFSETEE